MRLLQLVSFQDHAESGHSHTEEDEFGGFGIVINGHSLVSLIVNHSLCVELLYIYILFAIAYLHWQQVLWYKQGELAHFLIDMFFVENIRELMTSSPNTGF